MNENDIDIDELAVDLHNLAYKWAMLGGEKDFIVLAQLRKACKESPYHKLKESLYQGFEEGHWDRMTKEKKTKKRLSDINKLDLDKGKDKGLSR